MPILQLQTINEDTKTNPDAEATDDGMSDKYDFSQAIRGNPYQNLNQAPIMIRTNAGDREIQIKTVELLATIAPDGKVTLQLPPNITPGEHRITLLIQEDLTRQTT